MFLVVGLMWDMFKLYVIGELSISFVLEVGIWVMLLLGLFLVGFVVWWWIDIERVVLG